MRASVHTYTYNACVYVIVLDEIINLFDNLFWNYMQIRKVFENTLFANKLFKIIFK